MTRTTVGAVVFIAFALLGIVLEWRGRRSSGATATAALAAAMRTAPGRVTVLAVWIWLGVHFLAR